MRPLSDTEIRSLVELLDDEDPRSLALVRQQLLSVGDPVIRHLEEAHDRMEPRLRQRIDSVLFEARFQHLERGFLALSAQQDPDLETGAFLIARFARPDLDEPKYVGWLDDAARAVGRPLEGGDSYPLINALNLHLFNTLGLRGNEKRYYEPSNSFLDRVIDSRLGVPVSLSVLYLLVARRLNLPVHGAGLPGHYMVRCEPAPGRVFFVDCFHGGRLLTKAQCKQLLLRSGYQFREEFLEKTAARDTLARMMRNLISIYQKTGLTGKAEQMSTLVEILLTRRPAAGRAS